MLKHVRGSEHKTIGWASNEYVIGFYETTDYNHHISYLFQYLIAWQKVLEGQKQGDVVGTVPAKFKFPLTFHFFSAQALSQSPLNRLLQVHIQLY